MSAARNIRGGRPFVVGMRRAAILALLAVTVPAAPASARPGEVDRRFGRDGVAHTKAIDGGYAAMVQRDGRIVVAGGITRPGLVRLTPRGRFDRRFGTRGVKRVRRAAAFQPFGVQRGRDGIFRVATATTAERTAPVALLRVRAGRRARNDVLAHPEPFAGPISRSVQRPDGGAVVATWGGRLRAVAADGTLDTRFGGGTVDACALVTIRECMLSGLAVRRDGRVLASLTGRPNVVVQLSADGTLDAEFGRAGVARSGMGNVTALHVARDGDVILATGGARSTLARVVRLSRAGRRRTRFGGDGIARARTRPRGYTQIDAVTTDRRGRVYVLGEDLGPRSVVVRFSRDGTFARRFGSRGVARLPRPPRYGANLGERLVAGPRRSLYVVGGSYRHGRENAALDCGDIREDFCALSTRLAVWRLRR